MTTERTEGTESTTTTGRAGTAGKRPTEASVTWAQALAWRLGRHLLEPVGPASAPEVVRRLGAVLSMDESLADLAVLTRSTSARPGDLARALVEGTVVKAFAFRGSMHYLSPEDGGVYLSLRTAGRQWERASWVEYYRLRPQDWPDFRAAVREALTGGPLTVGELGEALARHRAYRHLLPVFDDGAGTLVKPLTWQGDMGFGPPRDGRHTFQRLDTNPRWAGVPPLEEAGPRAVLGYVRTYGPVTGDHLDRWLGKGLSAGGRRLAGWVAGLGDRLVALDVEGTAALVAREDVDALVGTDASAAADGAGSSDASGVVRFLPGHDQWVMGVGTADEHVVPPPLRQAMTRKANPVVVDGVVRGTWSRTGGRVLVTWAGAGPSPDVALRAEVARVGERLGTSDEGVDGALDVVVEGVS